MDFAMWLAPALTGTIALLYASAWWRARREVAALVPVGHRPLEEPLVVVIPARNEEDRLGPTLDAVLADESPALSVYVFDDASTDATADVVQARAAKDKRLRLLRGAQEELPPGVFGKPRALARAVAAIEAQHALPDVLLFLDADVVVEKGAVGGLVAALRRENAHALSGTPALVLKSLVEEALVPAFVSLVGERHRPTKVQAGEHAFLNGQCILIEREAYVAVGGFAAVETTVLEDVALGERLLAQQRRLRLADLRQSIATRMYRSWSEIALGFGKNARVVLGGKASLVRLACLGLALAWAPWGALATAVAFAQGASSDANAGLALLMTTSFYAIIVVFGGAVRKTMGAGWWPALVLPLVWSAVALVLLRAAFIDSVRWKGRAYSAPSSEPRGEIQPGLRKRPADEDTSAGD